MDNSFDEIMELLRLRIDAWELEGLYLGIFSADRTKLAASSYVSLIGADLEEKYWLFNAVHVDPFFRRLRIEEPREFVSFVALNSADYSIITSADLRHCLVYALAQHAELGYRVVWFYLDQPTGRFYRWTYPQPQFVPFSHSYFNEVIDVLRPISDWDDFQFLHSARTMDAPGFWENYVLKEEGGQKLFLL